MGKNKVRNRVKDLSNTNGSNDNDNLRENEEVSISEKKSKLERKIQKSQEKSERIKLLKKLLGILLIFVLVVLIIAVSIPIARHWIDELIYQYELTSSTSDNLTEIVTKIVYLGDEVLNFEKQFQAIDTGHKGLLTDDEAYKERLRPFRERLTSLTIQTSQYEKMEKISGGPMEFITSAFTEIELIINKKMIELDLEMEKSYKDQYDVANPVWKKWREFVEGPLQYVIKRSKDPKLTKEGIQINYFHSHSGEINKELRVELYKRMYHTPYEEVLDAFETLLRRLRILDTYLDRMQKLGIIMHQDEKKYDPKDPGAFIPNFKTPTEKNSRELQIVTNGVTEAIIAVQETILYDFEKYRLLIHHQAKKVSEIGDLAYKLVFKNPREGRYYNLREMLIEDLEILKERLKRLHGSGILTVPVTKESLEKIKKYQNI